MCQTLSGAIVNGSPHLFITRRDTDASTLGHARHASHVGADSSCICGAESSLTDFHERILCCVGPRQEANTLAARTGTPVPTIPPWFQGYTYTYIYTYIYI